MGREALHRLLAHEHGEGVAPRGLGARAPEGHGARGLVEVVGRGEAREVRAHERPQRLAAQRLEEREAHELGEIGQALAQRRHAQPRRRVEAHVEIGAEAPLAHERLDVLVRRGDELGRRGPRARVPEPRHRAALEHEQELPLQIEIEVRDLVEEQRAAVRLLEDARVVLDGAGVRAAPRPEQVGREQRRRDRRQIGDDERPLRARARVNDVLGEEAFSSARLALDEHGQRRAREHLELPRELRHGARAAPEDRPLLCAVAERERARDLGGEAPAVDDLVLAQVHERIVGAGRAQVRARRRQHDDRQLRVGLPQPLEDEQPLAAAQLLERRAARRGLRRQLRLVLGEQPLLGAREVQIEHDEIGQRARARERLGRLAPVVGAAQRTAALALLAHLTRHAPLAARDGLELRQPPVHHLHGLVAIIDDEQARHQLSSPSVSSKDRANASA